MYLFRDFRAILIASIFLFPSLVEAGESIIKFRGSSVKIYVDQTTKSKIDTLKTKTVRVPAEVIKTGKNGAVLLVRFVFTDTSRPTVDGWVKRFKVKTDNPPKLKVYCSGDESLKGVRTAGVRGGANEQCK